jgi:hypothetical protein
MSIASWMNQSIYVAAVTGIDQFGKPLYGPAVLRKVRVELGNRMVTRSTGEESVSRARFWCETPIGLTDRVWLPGASTADAESSSLPIDVSSVTDKNGGRTLYKVAL